MIPGENESYEERVQPKDDKACPISDAEAGLEDLLAQPGLPPDVRTAILELVDRHRRVESALRESQERYRALVDSAPVCIHGIDLEGCVTSMNPAGLGMLGLEDEGEIRGRRMTEFVSDKDLDRVRTLFGRATEGQEEGFEFDVKGSTQRFASCFVPIRTPDGAVVSLMGVTEDVTERRQAERAATRLGRILEDSLNEIYLFDAESLRFLQVNRGARENVGYSMAELAELTPLDLKPEFTSEAFEATIEPLRSGERDAIQFDTVHRRKDGSRYPVEVHLQLMRQQEPPVFVAIIVDLTQWRKQEEARRALEQQMVHSQKLESLGVLAGGIAHDFNNILVAILGNADLAARELPRDAPARRCIEEISKAAQRAAELAKEMLAYTGRGRFVIETIDLSGLVEEMAHLLEVATTKRARFRKKLAAGLPAINGDATQIRQVVMNLLTNASDAVGREEGEISIRTGTRECDRDYLGSTYLDDDLPPGMYVFVEVEDSGTGMSDDVQERVFDPFFSTKFTGRGLGLAAVLGIVRGHRGAIQIASKPGEGTTFTVLFPVAEVQDEVGRRRSEPATREWRGSGTVLVVDDEEHVRTLVEQILLRVGLKVLTAASGREAVEVFARHQSEVDAVILDLTMPGLDGVDSFRELRELSSEVPIVMASGFDRHEVSLRFDQGDLAAVIQKPFTFDELVGTVRSVLEGPEPTAEKGP